MTARTLALAGLCCAAAATQGRSQEPLVVSAVDSLSSRPVPEAVGSLVRARRTTGADRLGRIRFAPFARPDTLVVHGIGFWPETLVVDAGDTDLRVALRRRPVTLAELTVGAEQVADLAPATAGQWVVPHEAIGAVPPAVENDPLRALVVLPSVAFSSPLSARPVIRGYDAAESITRIDGFELVNPYHIGRIFAAFPADFTQSVNVAVTPHRITDTETLAGVVDLVGVPAGAPQQRNGGMDVTLTSGTGWYGWRGPMSGFAGARLASIELVTGVVAEKVPYGFRDGYAHLRLGPPAAPRADLTLFASRDVLGSPGTDLGLGVEWTNTLVGVRVRAVDRPRWSLDLTGSLNRFAFDGTGIEARYATIAVHNRFDRWNAAAEARWWSRGVEWRAGAGMGRRLIENEITVERSAGIPADAHNPRFTELTGFATARFGVGRAVVNVGGRADASPSVVAWQPRVRVSLPLGRGVAAAVSYARAARLFQLITDPQPEPIIAFYDYWRSAGDSGVPMGRVDHVSAELDVVRRRWTANLGFYASSGSGLGELRPIVDQTDTSAFRFGASRTAGMEVRLARRPRVANGFSVVLTYALGWSQRRWEDSVWRPWQLDQRHRVRLLADAPIKAGWRVFALAEARTAQPVARVGQIYYRDGPAVPRDSVVLLPGSPFYLYSPEGTVRGSGTVWLDIGTRWWFGGPGSSRGAIGFSVTNIIFGPVAPLGPEEFALDNDPRRVDYVRRFSLPPVPSLTVRFEF